MTTLRLRMSRQPDDRTCGATCLHALPVGHFVLLCGLDPADGQVLIADPYTPNPVSPQHDYHVSVERALGAILLGVITYDANLVVIHPPDDVEAAGA